MVPLTTDIGGALSSALAVFGEVAGYHLHFTRSWRQKLFADGAWPHFVAPCSCMSYWPKHLGSRSLPDMKIRASQPFEG